MGFAYKDFCFNTQAEAAASVCANQYPITYTSGTTVYTLNCTGVNASNQLTLSRLTNGASPTALTYATGFPSCSWADYPSGVANLSPTDGALVAAAVASVWLAAWAWKAIYATLDDRGSET